MWHSFTSLTTAIALLSCLLAAGGPPRVTRASAHRGDSMAAPENTLLAFASAVKKGAHQIEFDVKLSKDEALVIMHDITVDRTTNGKGKVADLTFDELRALDAGSWFSPRFSGTKIPTLQEVLETIPPSVMCNVHLSDAPIWLPGPPV